MRKLLVLLSAVAFVVAFTVPVMAADWSFYGSARMYTFTNDYSEEMTGLDGGDEDLSWFLQGNSRIGANVKAGDISGRFEYGSGPNLRLLYGSWNFGAGSLTVGQDYSPIDTFISNQQGPAHWGGDIDGLPWGGIYDGRTAQIKLKVGGFQIALVEPRVVSIMATTDTDTSIPKIEACYNFKVGPLGLKVLAAMNKHEDIVGNDKYDIDSNILGLMAKFAAGPFSIAGNVFKAKNPGNFGLLQDNLVTTAALVGNDVEDVDSLGFLLVAGFKINDMFTLEGGYGNLSNEWEVSGNKTEAETSSYYIQAVITLAKGFFLVPEYGKVDYHHLRITGAPDVDLGQVSYWGTKWQINF